MATTWSGTQYSSAAPPLLPGSEYLAKVKLDRDERLVGYMPEPLAAHLSEAEWAAFVRDFNDAIDQHGRVKRSILRTFGLSLCWFTSTYCTCGFTGTTNIRVDVIPTLLHDTSGLNPMLESKGLQAVYWHEREADTATSTSFDGKSSSATYYEYKHFVRFQTIPSPVAAPAVITTSQPEI